MARPSNVYQGQANGRCIKATAKLIAVLSRPASLSGRFLNNGRCIKANCSFIGQMLQMADFIWSRVSSLSAAKLSYFYQGLAKPVAVLSRPASPNGCCVKAIKAAHARWPLYQGQWPFYQGVIKEEGYIRGHFGREFRVILFGASLTLARHVQWLHARARLTGGSLRVASSRSPRVCSAPAASGAVRRSARRPLTVVRASLCLGFRV